MSNVTKKLKLEETHVGRKLAVMLAAAILTTEAGSEGGSSGGEGSGAGGGEGAAGGEGGAGAGSGEGGSGEGAGGEGSSPDLATLFSPEEIEVRKTEATRRAALTDEERAAEDQARAEDAAKNAPPEEYADFTAADGIVLDPEMISTFKGIAKEIKGGLSQGDAQKLVDLAVQVQQRTMDGIFAAHEDRKATWLKEAQEDPEIGEDVKKWDPAVKDSAKDSVAIRAFNTIAAGSPALKAAVDELGIGNHPEFLRMFYRIGKNMREDTFEQGQGGGSGGKTTAQALWPDMK